MDAEEEDRPPCAHESTTIKLSAVGRLAVELGRDPCKAWTFGAGAPPMWLCAHREVCTSCGRVIQHSLGRDTCPWAVSRAS